MRLIVGLGNPGPSYKHHRHNVGFMVLDRLADRAGAFDWREKFTGRLTRVVLAGTEVNLLQPQTFMNLSGRSVLKALSGTGTKPDELVVVHDDLDLPFGTVRVKSGGGHGGHNGLRDIIAAIGPEWIRVRIGIGRPTVGTVEHFVLSPFTSDEQAQLPSVIDQAVTAIDDVVVRGAELAMNRTNTRPKKTPG